MGKIRNKFIKTKDRSYKKENCLRGYCYNSNIQPTYERLDVYGINLISHLEKIDIKFLGRKSDIPKVMSRYFKNEEYTVTPYSRLPGATKYIIFDIDNNYQYTC